MTPAEITAALQVAFAQCELLFCSLTDRQKQILLQTLVEELVGNQGSDNTNPLDELTPEERQALLEFVKQQEGENSSWKIKLLNDWLENKSSGTVQFIRDRYGLVWLNQIQPVHLAQYYEQENTPGLSLKVGDRIEVSNSLWEWVQDEGPCTREWIPCTVIGIYDAVNSFAGADSPTTDSYTNCIIRFDSGVEYEIQGIYEWNSYHWRWPL